MFSSIREAWGEPFYPKDNNIFKQSDKPEHFIASEYKFDTSKDYIPQTITQQCSKCAKCTCGMNKQVQEHFADNTVTKDNTVNSASLGIDDKDLTQAILVGILVILVLHLLNKNKN